MRYLVLLLLLTIDANAFWFTDDRNDNSYFNNELKKCYSRHLDVRQDNPDVFVRLYDRMKVLDDKNATLSPLNPIDIGMDADAYFDYSMHFYNNLNRFLLDENMKHNEPDLLSHLQCQFDIWMVEQDQVDTEEYEKIAKENFIHNFNGLMQLFNKDAVVNRDKSFDSPINRYTKCYIVYFDKHSYKPLNDIDNILVNIGNRIGYFRSYYILLTTMLDWRVDSHEAKVFAKKRMMYVRDILANAGVGSRKIRGEIKDSTCINSKLKIDNALVKICLIDGLIGRMYGKELLDDFDFTQTGERKPKITIIKNKSK